MADPECVHFLQWALPKLHLRWQGFRKVRGQVCKRLDRRRRTLGLDHFGSYQDYLLSHPEEWKTVDALCRITISRFYRDRRVFDFLRELLMPELARLARSHGSSTLRCWSAGCASGEEPYTLSFIWSLSMREAFPDMDLEIVATDADSDLLERARRGRFGVSSLKELPEPWRELGFEKAGKGVHTLPTFQEPIEFQLMDLRESLPQGTFHLVMCRNLAFTYFDTALQEETLRRLATTLIPGGALVLGAHESIPEGQELFSPNTEKLPVYRRISSSA